MSQKVMTVKFVNKPGCPMLMHNGQLADPLNEWAIKIKAIASKRKKVDADHERISELEFMGGLYLDDNNVPAIPGIIVGAVIRDCAKKAKRGKDVSAGVQCDEQFIPLVYDGPKNPVELYKDKRFVDRRRCVVGTSTVMRTRPIFREWEFTAHLNVDTDTITHESIIEILPYGRTYVGFGDYTQYFGHFDFKVL